MRVRKKKWNLSKNQQNRKRKAVLKMKNLIRKSRRIMSKKKKMKNKKTKRMKKGSKENHRNSKRRKISQGKWRKKAMKNMRSCMMIIRRKRRKKNKKNKSNKQKSRNKNKWWYWMIWIVPTLNIPSLNNHNKIQRKILSNIGESNRSNSRKIENAPPIESSTHSCRSNQSDKLVSHRMIHRRMVHISRLNEIETLLNRRDHWPNRSSNNIHMWTLILCMITIGERRALRSIIE